MDKPTQFISYALIDSFIQKVAPDVSAFEPTLIVGILRGGGIPALLLSQLVDVPVSFVRFDRARGEVHWASAQEPPERARVVLVEDVAGSGITLQRSLEFLQQRCACQVKVLTLVADDASRVAPDWSLQVTGKKAVFPWERFGLNPEHLRDQACLQEGIGHMKSNPEYERWGFDLDGVFLQDVEDHLYVEDLPRALELRHTFDFVKPDLVLPSSMVIVTGRMITDRERTLQWLRGTELEGLELLMRETKQDEPCGFKIKTAERLGLTHFVESNPGQAIRIAKALPHLRVMHYDFPRGEGVWITAI